MIIPAVKTVGQRHTGGTGIQEQASLARTAAALRGTTALVPMGVYRFDSFDEAQSWMNEMIRLTHARLSRRTSPASAAR